MRSCSNRMLLSPSQKANQIAFQVYTVDQKTSITLLSYQLVEGSLLAPP